MKLGPGKLLPPEVVQTSGMDCGSACLTSVLLGYGMPASYDRLRELCQTSVDGTSIDVIEATAQQLGLVADQIMIPLDHLLLREGDALPAIVVVLAGNGSTHFVVAWGRVGGRWVSVMDPATGRRYPSREEFLREVYRHSQRVPAEAWAEWAASDEFTRPLRRRLRDLGSSAAVVDPLLEETRAAGGWRGWARLDAATRLTSSLVSSGALGRGTEAARFLAGTLANPNDYDRALPSRWWCVRPDPEDPETLLYRGAVLIRFRGPSPEAPAPEALGELARVTAERPVSGTRRFLGLLRQEGRASLFALGLTLFLASTTVVIEAVLLRGLLDLHRVLRDGPQRFEVFAAVVLLVLLGVALRIASDARSRELGRRIEAKLRIALRTHLPRLHDRYFRSRPVSDMAQRAHEVHQVRTAVSSATLFVRSGCEIVLTVLGMMLLHPPAAWLTALAALAGIGVPLLALPVQSERDLRTRTYQGALFRFLLDSLLGLSAVRAHQAERALDRQQESLLGEWSKSRLALEKSQIAGDGVQLSLVLSIVIVVVLHYLATSPRPVDALLLTYWGLELAFRCRLTVMGLRQVSLQANVLARVLEPLGQALEPEVDAPPDGGEDAVGFCFEKVEIQAGGHVLLRDIDLEVTPGEHVAIVGPSGAGKSTLIGSLLGWHLPSQGRLLVDGEALAARNWGRLRRRIAWVDPSVQLWNRTLLENLVYGSEDGTESDWLALFDAVEIREFVQHLPEGLQSPLGEGGLSLSGGEGQRVRLGRAWRRSSVGLVLLDEAFRGLGREQRRRLLRQAREHWRGATLLCVTHDVAETAEFDRVLVVEQGQLVEDGSPSELAAAASRYSQLLKAEAALSRELWERPLWSRRWLQDGRLRSVGETAP